MTSDAKPGATPQESRVILMNAAEARPLFFSKKIGRNFASPMGGWTMDRRDATAMPAAEADQLLAGALQHEAPSIQKVPA